MVMGLGNTEEYRAVREGHVEKEVVNVDRETLTPTLTPRNFNPVRHKDP
jgi:hypothetical protein